MLRLFIMFFGAIFAVIALVAVDFNRSSREFVDEDGLELTFNQYLAGYGMKVPDFGAMMGGAPSEGDVTLPSELIKMVPVPPKGWTVRPAEAGDTAAYLPKKAKDLPKDARKFVENVARKRSGKGLDQLSLTYENGRQQVIFQVVRYPDVIFTSFEAMQQRMELQMLQSPYRQTEFMTVRGLVIVEDLLPKGVSARYFSANVGAQIQIRVVASKGMLDEDLLAFFETLHVKAMNNNVVDKLVGLGDVPVIVLASALDQDTRAAYVAERIAREKAEADDREAARMAEELAVIGPEKAQNDALDRTGSRLKGEGRLNTLGDNKGKMLPGACEDRLGTKFCAVNGADLVKKDGK